MHAEATAHYIDMIDQISLRYLAIRTQFNKVSRSGWQIDPLGQSAVQAYLLGAELGFDSVHFAKIDYQDRAKRKDDKTLEVIWQGSKTLANVTGINHIMWTMGDDFQYQYAESWFKQMDKLIHYVNKGGRVNALHSTPSLYTHAKYVANESWPLKTDNYFLYADSPNAYWTGFFTSRRAFKRCIRMLNCPPA